MGNDADSGGTQPQGTDGTQVDATNTGSAPPATTVPAPGTTAIPEGQETIKSVDLQALRDRDARNTERISGYQTAHERQTAELKKRGFDKVDDVFAVIDRIKPMLDSQVDLDALAKPFTQQDPSGGSAEATGGNQPVDVDKLKSQLLGEMRREQAATRHTALDKAEWAVVEAAIAKFPEAHRKDALELGQVIYDGLISRSPYADDHPLAGFGNPEGLGQRVVASLAAGNAFKADEGGASAPAHTPGDPGSSGGESNSDASPLPARTPRQKRLRSAVQAQLGSRQQ